MANRHSGLLLIAACLAALALRVLVPTGWMPAPGNDLVLSLCSGGSVAGQPLLPANDGGGSPCDYALALGPALASAGPLMLVLLAQPLVPAMALRPPRAIVHRHRSRPPGQGPPRA